ncbi:hypothetical protein LTR17_010201 [Elasticomyces elasticus]|nr:hypothetical protein LTR17_010201 [Elasticomyces elasticus]
MAEMMSRSDDSGSNVEKSGFAQHDVVHDKDLLAAVNSRDTAMMHLTEEELVIEKKLVKKIDLVIMPTIVLVYLMNYIDRNNYPAARLAGLEEDLDMTGNQFQIGLSVLFVGYVLMQVPSNMLLNWCGRPAYYIGFWTMVWGTVSALTSLCQSYGHIVACRFILGFVEAPFFPGVLFYLSKWYTKKELNLRMSIFYSGSLLAGAFGNLIAGGILEGLDGARGMRAWRWLYIVEGSITVVIGIAVCFILPDFPDTWKNLAPELRHVANRRMAIDAAEADVDVGGGMSQLQGAKLAFADPKTYLLAAMYHCIVGATGFQNFFPSLTRTLGYGRVISLLLVAPPYIFIMIWALAHSVGSDKLQSRFWFFVYPIPLSIIGCFVFMFTDGFGPRYFSLFLLNFVFASFGTVSTTRRSHLEALLTPSQQIYSWNSNVIARPPAKRSVALAFMNSVGNAASIWTPFTYIDGSEPYYRPALGIVIGLLVACAAMAVMLRIVMQRMNKELDRLENEDVILTEKELVKLRKTAEIEGIDLAAARQLQKGYRYII